MYNYKITLQVVCGQRIDPPEPGEGLKEAVRLLTNAVYMFQASGLVMRVDSEFIEPKTETDDKSKG